MPRRKREKSPFELGMEYGERLADQAEAPGRRSGRRKSRQESGGDLFSILFEWSDRKKLEKQAQQQQALIAARQRELGSAWQRAMVEFFPNHDANTFPPYPHSLSAKGLEHLAEHIYARFGYQVEHTGGAGDGGVDVWLEKFGEKEIVQCKQYQKPVQPDTIRAVYGALARKARKAYVWAPGGFTEAAREEAKRFSRIELIDEQSILELVEKAYPPPPSVTTPEPDVPVLMNPQLETEEPLRRYFGMTGAQIAILLGLGLLVLSTFAYLAYLISQSR